MVRLFTAIDLPGEQKRSLHEMVQTLSGIRVTPVAQLHLTLNFIGEADATLFRKLREECLTITMPPFSLRLEGVATFPSHGRPRILWAGLAPCPPLIQLQQLLKKILLDAGISQEKRPFHPHITLARIKSSSRTDLSSFCQNHAQLTFPPFTVTDFHLYSSNLTKTGATHNLEQSFKLQGDAEE
ncbi:MAG: RNA 2',3'-cyclic phosphodiesterase [Proteobacteria bacterium]|nr:RNA 2',3'-cyclic phosphodiesterase [Pseudomonadota bacterium]